MSENQEFSLPEDFFDRNPMSGKTTSGHLSYFQMWTLYEPDFDNWIDDEVVSNFDEQRKNTLLEERAVIESLNGPEEIINYMRKPIEISNRNLLCRRAVEMGEDLFPLLIDRLSKNGWDLFIECAMLSLSRAEDVYIDRVAEEFLSFRNAYARAAATVLLAFRERNGSLQDLYSLYLDLRSSGDEEDYDLSETVLFSIYLLSGRLKNLQEDLSSMIGDVFK